VINVALLGIIRRWHIRDQIPLREIARRLGISRNTVRRYLRSETTEPTYAERRIVSGLDKYSVQLSGWLKAETSKPRKQRRSLKQIHADLKELGYEGSYDRVAAFARQWKAGQTEWVNSSSKRTGLNIRRRTVYCLASNVLLGRQPTDRGGHVWGHSANEIGRRSRRIRLTFHDGNPPLG
jgi:transcriptional regulator with XRE-family HTH domain